MPEDPASTPIDPQALRGALDDARRRLEEAIGHIQGGLAPAVSTRPSPALWDNNSSCNSSCSSAKLEGPEGPIRPG